MFARHFAANFVNLLIIALLVAGGALLWGKAQFNGAGPLTETKIFEVKRGDALGPVADRLEAEGVISNATIFRVGARYQGQDTNLKFGEYEVGPETSMADVLAVITSGRGLSYQVTFPEGWSVWRMVERLKEVDDLTGEISELPPEGSLAPNTYAYSRGDTRQSILNKMQIAQVAILDAAWDARAEDLPLKSKEEVLIVASILEGETPVKSELPLVSGVIINRLDRGVPLGMDSTTVYEFTQGDPSKMRDIRRSDLLKDTPYNTRRFAGLPPTAIGNPGKLAIEAAVNPEKTDFMFFVADGTGGHAFAKTLAEHNVNVANWRKIERQKQIEENKAKENQGSGG